MKKKWYVVLLACVLLVSLTACGGSSKEAEDTLYVYCWSEYIPQSVYQKFEEETGIKVVESTFSSNEEMLAKLEAGGLSQYDVVIASNYVLEAMKQQDFIQKIDKDQLKNLDQIEESTLDQSFDPDNDYSIPYMASITMIAVNREKLDELGVDIHSYNDLLNPALKNNIVVPDDSRELVDAALKALGDDPDSRDEDVIMGTNNWLNKLAQNVKLYDSDTPYTALATNEVAVGLVYNMDAAKAMNENDNIELVSIEEPLEMAYDNFVVTSSSTKMKSAMAFMDFVHRPDIYKTCLEEFPNVCLNKGALQLMDEEFLNNPAANVSEDLIINAHVTQDVGEAAAYYDTAFSQMKN